jgi:hypothetical protein
MTTPIESRPCPFRLAFASHGVRIGIRTNSAAILDALAGDLPPEARPVDFDAVQEIFTAWSRADDPAADAPCAYYLLQGERPRFETDELGLALHTLAGFVHSTIALESTPSIFVHAGVVGWKDAAIVIPGRSMSGKSSLVAALVQAKATYYSDEYAVFDEYGHVHAYPIPLHIRGGIDGRVRRCRVDELGGRAGTVALPVRLVVATQYQPGAAWTPRLLSPAETVAYLFNNTVDALRRPQCAINVFSQVAMQCVAVSGPRPSCNLVVPLLVGLCDRLGAGLKAAAALEACSQLAGVNLLA